MATRTWIANAVNVKQVTTVAVSGTWATNDTATITINGKDLTVTIGANTSTAQVATSIQEAFMGETLTDTSASSSPSIADSGGQSMPEFAEITATVDSSTVTFTSNTAGVPFTISVSETTAGSGALGSPTEATAATGKNHFDNADNWSGGSVPVDADDIVFDGNVSTESCLYGLSQSSVTPASITVMQSFTGDIGLPERRQSGTSTYDEYRETYLTLGNSGDATNTAIQIGEGSGSGPRRLKLNTGSGQITMDVFNSGSTKDAGLTAIQWKGTHASNSINIRKGSFGAALLPGESATLALTQTGGTVVLGNGCTVKTIEKTGGSLTALEVATSGSETLTIAS